MTYTLRIRKGLDPKWFAEMAKQLKLAGAEYDGMERTWTLTTDDIQFVLGTYITGMRAGYIEIVEQS